MPAPPIRLPTGVRDFLPRAAARRRALAERVMAVFEAWGYSRIITPAVALGASFGFAAMVSVHFQMPATSAILAAAACWWGVMIASGSALIPLARSSGTSLESIAIAGGISLFLLLTLPPVALAERVIQALPVSGWTAWTMTAAAAGNTGDAALWLIPSLAFGAACALCARTRG